MHIRRAFSVFLELHSEATPHIADWTLDWRWFHEPADGEALPSERPLIDWPAWTRPLHHRPSTGRGGVRPAG